jgi:membrane-bound inhibitor of C-type lysozyme
MFNFNTVFALCAAATLASCATVARGTTDDVVINYSPSDAKVTTSLNHACATNPCTVKAPRKEPFDVTVSKPGYETQTVHVATGVSRKGAAGMAGNVLIGGIIGIGVDAATGAAKDHYPNPVNVQLQPTGSSSSPEPALTPAKPKRRRGVPVS